MRLWLLHGIGHGAAFGDGERQRLLAINILAGPGGFDDGNGMPVVGRCDQDRVDVFAGEEFAEVLVGGRSP